MMPLKIQQWRIWVVSVCRFLINAKVTCFHVHQTESWSEYLPVSDKQTAACDALRYCSLYCSISDMKPSFLWSWGQTEGGGQREIKLLWVSHLHTSTFCPHTTPLLFLLHPVFEVSNHLKANKKGWEGQACPEVEQSRVSFVVIAKLCDLNAGYLKKEHCSSCMTAWSKRYWIM